MDPVTSTAAANAVSAVAHVIKAAHALVTHAAPAAAVVAKSDQAVALHSLIATLVGLALSQTVQASIEHNLATKRWMPQGFKPVLPVLISALLGYIATIFGVSPTDATTGAGSLTLFTHLVNSSPKLASVGKDPTPEEKAVASAAAAAKKVTSGDPRV